MRTLPEFLRVGRATRRAICAVLLFIFAAALPAFVSAQSLDTGFLGRVVDSSGAVVPGASVKITALSTGTVHSVETSATGDYQVHYLTPGAYTIEIQKQGFQTERRANIALSLDQMARVDFTLQLGAVQQTVSVTGVAPLLQT
ncbi:MAG: carboxypeptidase-like regulatory domain-containing protein, partial [Terriglobia bacterium]